MIEAVQVCIHLHFKLWFYISKYMKKWFEKIAFGNGACKATAC